MFDRASAERDLSDYRSGIIKKNSRLLVGAITALPLQGGRLLDIGGGIGVSSFELFKVGLARSMHVELSEAYADVFESEVKRLGLNAVCLRGDFVHLHDRVPESELVCLDKVICCYPDFDDLVTRSSSKAMKWYAIVIPRDTWWVKLVNWIGNAWRSFTGSGFRTFVHPVAGIEAILSRSGFVKTCSLSRWEWMTMLFSRT
jgi:magnesium-protoporphyrin O-methyltransferase